MRGSIGLVALGVAVVAAGALSSGCPARSGGGSGGTDTKTQTTTLVPRAMSPTRTPEPARPIVPRAQMTRTPWRLARVGDWAIINYSSGGRRKKVVREVTDERIVIDTFRLAADGTETPHGQPEEMDLQFEETDFVDYRTQDFARIEAQEERRFSAGTFVVYHVIREAGGNRTDIFFCPELPFNRGVVRSLRGGNLTFDVEDFGHAAGD